jgi:hypothetical protein
MAKTLKTFEFGSMSHGRGGNYDKYLDGQIWELTLKDAIGTESIETFRSTLQGAARRRSGDGWEMRMQTRILREYFLNEDTDEQEVIDEVLVVRAYKIDSYGEEIPFDTK